MGKEYLGREIHNHTIDKLAVANSVFAGLALFPQVYKVLATLDTTSLSTVSLLIIFCNSLVWIIYGLHRALTTIIISSFLTALAAGILLIAVTAI